MKKLACLIVLLSAVCTTSFAAVYVDPASAGPLHNGKTWKTAYVSINQALAKTKSGEIWVKQGVYNERITMSKYQNLIGGFAGVETSVSKRKGGETIIDAEAKGRAVDVLKQSFCKIDGFTIRNGVADRGAGIRCNTNSTVKILNCHIENCTASDQGGAIYYGTYTYGEVSDCTIYGNSAPLGGGLVVEYHSYPVMRRDIIGWNYATVSGGGLYSPFHSGARTEYCIFAFNKADVSGGAAYAYQGGPVTFINTIMAFNSAPAGGGVYGGGVTSATTLTKCCLWANEGGDFGGVLRTPPASAKNVYADPLFVDAANGDFRLLPGSPVPK